MIGWRGGANGEGQTKTPPRWRCYPVRPAGALAVRLLVDTGVRRSREKGPLLYSKESRFFDASLCADTADKLKTARFC